MHTYVPSVRPRHRGRLLAAAAALALLGAALAGCTTSPNVAVTLEEDPTLPNHSVYRPTDLASVPGKLPIVVMGATGCTFSGGTFRELLSEIASKGYLVIADLPIDSNGSDTPEILLAGVTWAIGENTRTGSRYRGRLDTTKVAAMGHSCGGLEALHIGGDPRISTVLALNSGIFASGGLGGATKDDLKELHGPTLWMNGGPQDIAYPQAVSDFADVPAYVPAVFANYDLSELGGGPFGAHKGTFFEPKGGEMGKAVVAWLDFTLKGNATAGQQFIGACALCSVPKWTVQSKHF